MQVRDGIPPGALGGPAVHEREHRAAEREGSASARGLAVDCEQVVVRKMSRTITIRADVSRIYRKASSQRRLGGGSGGDGVHPWKKRTGRPPVPCVPTPRCPIDANRSSCRGKSHAYARARCRRCRDGRSSVGTPHTSSHSLECSAPPPLAKNVQVSRKVERVTLRLLERQRPITLFIRKSHANHMSGTASQHKNASFR